MQRWTRARALGWSLLGLVILASASAWYVRPRGPARRLGIDWHDATSQARCITNRRETMCTTWTPSPVPADYTTVQFNPWTRHLSRASRTWMVLDSARLSLMVDSVRAAMDRAHGERVICDRSVTGFPIAEAWRFGGYETRLYAGEFPATRRRPASWYLGLQAVPWGAVGCGRDFRYVLLTPAQIAQRLQDWAVDHLGF